MHPGAWVAWSAGASVVTLSTTNPFYLLILFGAAWAVQAAWGDRGRGVGSFRFFVGAGLVAMALRTVLVVFGPVNSGSIVVALLEGLRVAVLLAVYGAFNSVSDASALLRLAPRRLQEVALAASLGLTLAPRFAETAQQVSEAQRMRGLGGGRWARLPALCVPVLESGMEQALVLAESMDARGHGRGRRSRYRPQPFGAWSWATAALSAVGVVAFIASASAGAGDLLVPAAPLGWPQATGPLIAAALSFCAPALWPPTAR
ncbi:MAG: energy-coupling factor transporter transmembrane protein EcfT [Actinomycetota bacterium]|nr:energy-coupling factor transporter transmembrane protein EcfT [Actinomycetota bacterium]